MAYEAVRVDDVYDSFISLKIAEPQRDSPETRARMEAQMIGLLPMPEERKIKRGKAGSSGEFSWMRD